MGLMEGRTAKPEINMASHCYGTGQDGHLSRKKADCLVCVFRNVRAVHKYNTYFITSLPPSAGDLRVHGEVLERSADLQRK